MKYLLRHSTIISWKIVSLSYSAQDDSPLVYVKEEYEENTISVNFVYQGRNKKVALPVFREGSHNEFLCLIQNVDNWMYDYSMKQDVHIYQVFETFVECLKGYARESWIMMLIEYLEAKTLASWWRHLGRYIKQMSPEEAARKQVKYLNDIRNQRN